MAFVGKWKLVSSSGEGAFVHNTDPYKEIIAKARDPINEVVEELDLKDNIFTFKVYVNGEVINSVETTVGKEVVSQKEKNKTVTSC